MAKTYDLKNVVLIVGPSRVEGFGETDAIGFEWNSDIVTPTVTADGQYIYSRNNDRGLMVTLTISQKSSAYLFLAFFLEAQHGDNLGIHPPVIIPLGFAMIDPSTGESITSFDCVFISRPAPSKNKLIGEVQFKLHLPNPKVTPALANII